MKEAAYKRYLLSVLLLILAFNLMERWALGLVLQDIKVDLDLTDTQLGLLTGIAFSVFYAVMGIPIARWADRGNRVAIISVTTALWSVAVAMCAMAGSFLQLLLVRIAVAVGEAGCMPPAHSLIADHFTRAERPRAVARYMLGGPLSVVFGFLLAGWLNQVYGWRVTFLVLGLPGLALAALTWFTLREPRRARALATVARVDQASAGSQMHPELAAQPGLREVWNTLWASRTFRNLLLGFSIIYFFGAGIATWQPTFLIRSYGLSTGELGTWLTVIYGAGGLLGTYWGGEWASRCAPGNERLQLKVIAAIYAGFGMVSAAIYLAPNLYVALGLMAVGGVVVNLAIGPVFATIQTLVPDRMRAMSIACVYFVANLIGMGLGPLAAGALSDALRPWLMDEALRYALLALCPGYCWGAYHYWRGSLTVTRDLLNGGRAC